MNIIEINDELDRDAVERAVGNAGSLKGLRSEEEACYVTRSEFDYALVELTGNAVAPVRGNGA